MAHPHPAASDSAVTRSFGIPGCLHGFAWGATILLAMLLVGLANLDQNRFDMSDPRI